MNKIFKYSLIINIIFLFIFLLFVFSGMYADYYDRTNVSQPQYDSNGNPMVSTIPSYSLGLGKIISNSIIILAVILAILILFFVARYVYFNPDLKGFFTSLVIPIIFIVFSFILFFVRESFNRCSGEECMYGLYIGGYYLVIFILSLFVSFITFLIKRKG